MLFNSRRVKTEQPLPFSNLAFLASSPQFSPFGLIQKDFQINGVRAPIHRFVNTSNISYKVDYIKDTQSQFSLSPKNKGRNTNSRIRPISSKVKETNEFQNHQIARFVPSSDRIRSNKTASRFYSRKEKFKDSAHDTQFQIINSLQKTQILSRQFNLQQKSPKIKKIGKSHKSLNIKQISQIPVLISFVQKPQIRQRKYSAVLRQKMSEMVRAEHRKKSQQIQSPLYLKPTKVYSKVNDKKKGENSNCDQEEKQKGQLLKLKKTINDNLKWMAKKPLRSSHTVKLKNDRILQAFT